MCILYSVNSILNWMKEIALAFSKMMDSFLAYFTTACTHHADVVSRKTCKTPAKPRICGYNEDPTFTGGHKKMALLDLDKQTQPVQDLDGLFLAIFEDFPTLPRYEFSSTTLSTILLMIRLQLMCRSLYIHITCTHT